MGFSILDFRFSICAAALLLALAVKGGAEEGNPDAAATLVIFNENEIGRAHV